MAFKFGTFCATVLLLQTVTSQSIGLANYGSPLLGSCSCNNNNLNIIESLQNLNNGLSLSNGGLGISNAGLSLTNGLTGLSLNNGLNALSLNNGLNALSLSNLNLGNAGVQQLAYTAPSSQFNVLSGSPTYSYPSGVYVTSNNDFGGAVSVAGGLPFAGSAYYEGNVQSNGQAGLSYSSGQGVGLTSSGCGYGLNLGLGGNLGNQVVGLTGSQVVSVPSGNQILGLAGNQVVTGLGGNQIVGLGGGNRLGNQLVGLNNIGGLPSCSCGNSYIL